MDANAMYPVNVLKARQLPADARRVPPTTYSCTRCPFVGDSAGQAFVHDRVAHPQP